MTRIRNVTLSPSGIYKYRRVVPKHLRTALGKSEIKVSLGRDRTEAVRQAEELNAETDRKFSEFQENFKDTEIQKEGNNSGFDLSKSRLEYYKKRKSFEEYIIDLGSKEYLNGDEDIKEVDFEEEDRLLIEKLENLVEELARNKSEVADEEITYHQAVDLAGIWMKEKLSELDADIFVWRSSHSPVREFLENKGIKLPEEKVVVRPIFDICFDVPLFHDDGHSFSDLVRQHPELKTNIREAAKVDIDFTGCHTDEDRMEKILLTILSNPGLSHTDIETEIWLFCIEQNFSLNLTNEGNLYVRNAICRAWLTVVRESRKRKSEELDISLPKDLI